MLTPTEWSRFVCLRLPVSGGLSLPTCVTPIVEACAGVALVLFLCLLVLRDQLGRSDRVGVCVVKSPLVFCALCVLSGVWGFVLEVESKDGEDRREREGWRSGLIDACMC